MAKKNTQIGNLVWLLITCSGVIVLNLTGQRSFLSLLAQGLFAVGAVLLAISMVLNGRHQRAEAKRR